MTNGTTHQSKSNINTIAVFAPSFSTLHTQCTWVVRISCFLSFFFCTKIPICRIACLYSTVYWVAVYLPLEKGKWRLRRCNFIFTHTYELRDFQISHFSLANCEHKLPASRSIQSMYFDDASAAGICHNFLDENTILCSVKNSAIDTDWVNESTAKFRKKNVANTILLLFSSSFSFLSYFSMLRLNKLSPNSLDKYIRETLTYSCIWIDSFADARNKQKNKVALHWRQANFSSSEKRKQNESVSFLWSKTICVKVRIGE